MLVSRAKFEGFLTGYGLVLAMVMATTALVLVHGGSVLNYAFPAAATIIAGILVSARRSVYVAFVWWIWLFTPLVRRLVDYQSGYHNISPVMLSPLLVTSFAFLSIMVRPSVMFRRTMAPFLLIFLAFALALVVGAATSGPLPAVYDFLNWILPVAFAVFLMSFPQEIQEFQEAFMFAVVLGLVLIGVYGLYQFYHIPPWDAYWINASHFDTAGQAADEQVRLFGTLNSPGPYGLVLMASLISLLAAKGPLRLAGGAFGIPAFGLSLVRAAWGGFVVGALFFVWRVGGKTRIRILVVMAVVMVAAVPLLTVGPVADALSARLSTLNNIQQDSSFQARQGLYESQAALAFEQPIGTGFGKFGLAAKLTTGEDANFDSGILQIAFQFGWVGGSLFAWGVGVLVFRVLSGSRLLADRVAIAGGSVFLASLTQNIFTATFNGVAGLALWSGLALALCPVGGLAGSPTLVRAAKPDIKERLA